MPRDGSGNFIPIQNSWYPSINNTDALPEDWEAQFIDMTGAIGASVAADGQKTMEGNLKMGNFQVTGLGSPSAEGNALRREQIQKGDDIPSSAALPIPLEGNIFDITGTTTITGLSASFVGREVWLRFLGVLQITNGPSLVLPNENITTENGDIAKFIMQSPGVWRLVHYQKTGSPQIGFTIIYPNGGSAASPASLSANSRYLEANPFPGFRVFCQAEVLVSGSLWGTTGWLSWVDNAAVPRAWGVAANQHNDDGIAVTVGVNGCLSATVNASGSSFGAVGALVSAPCRVKIWKVMGKI